GEDVLLDGELAEDAGLLGEVAHAEPGPLVHRQGGDFLAGEVDAPGVGRDLAGGHAEAGGLAGAVGAGQADDLAGGGVEVDAVDDLAAAVELDEPAHFQDRHPGALEGKDGGRTAAAQGAASGPAVYTPSGRPWQGQAGGAGASRSGQPGDLWGAAV